MKSANSLELLVNDRKPAKPFRFVRSCPKTYITSPELAHSAVMTPRLQHGVDRLFEPGRQLVSLAVELRAESCSALTRHRSEKLIEGVGEELHPFLDQLRRHLVD